MIVLGNLWWHSMTQSWDPPTDHYHTGLFIPKSSAERALKEFKTWPGKNEVVEEVLW